MPAFQLLPAPVFSPTRCVSCMANKSEFGFVDLLVDDEALNGYSEVDGSAIVREGQNFGHLYLCGDCVGAAATLLHWRSPERIAEIEQMVANLDLKIAALEAELDVERSPESKVVSLTQLGDYIAAHRPQTGTASTATLEKGS